MKGEDSAEAKIKSFDEVRAETVQTDFCLFVIKDLFKRFDVVFIPRSTRSTNSWRAVWPQGEES